MEDLNTRTESVIGGGSEEDKTPPDLDQDEIAGSNLEEIADNGPRVEGESQGLQEELTDDPEYEREADGPE